MPASEYAQLSGSSTLVGMTQSPKSPKTATVTSEPAKISHDYDYESDDEIAAAKTEQQTASPPKTSILAKVKAKLSSDSKSAQPTASASKTSSSKSTTRQQARADTVFAYKVLAETRM
ncbi:hypothetical protein PFICI_14906 [Pestalotiopsis fici W106-1]|uniref:Uncharacterized protein n=1 Tax=Pestalotiopsis fici (strain W106-1 / CGMCC3.15140) TaxID=1229662 RepID=W3WKG3_PESFW|nr:uncharacterized protein PFICI_14906 [Pestalotiopsis fici W106-1]ETS73301.1 hypothetical protein PFICI_14906 [Pestalotiopsis fici W106-1]